MSHHHHSISPFYWTPDFGMNPGVTFDSVSLLRSSTSPLRGSWYCPCDFAVRGNWVSSSMKMKMASCKCILSPGLFPAINWVVSFFMDRLEVLKTVNVLTMCLWPCSNSRLKRDRERGNDLWGYTYKGHWTLITSSPNLFLKNAFGFLYH